MLVLLLLEPLLLLIIIVGISFFFLSFGAYTSVSVVSSIDGCELSSSVYNVTKVVTKFIVPYKSYCLVCPTFKNASGLKWNYGTDNTLLYRDDIQRSTHHSLSLNINDPECSDTKYSLELSASHVGTAEGFYTCWERDQAIAAFCLQLVGTIDIFCLHVYNIYNREIY